MTTIDVDIQLSTDPTQRRRQQNRIAQRKFREKKDQQHQAREASGDDTTSNLKLSLGSGKSYYYPYALVKLLSTLGKGRVSVKNSAMS
ncbi:hypothetical protein ANO14919_057710 [Xylariales sp. No.14919]|nr:hypothetical protein ANO14919_057710 [Xylariales sp. No.14919]